MTTLIRRVLAFSLTLLLCISLSSFFVTRTAEPPKTELPPAQRSDRYNDILKVLMPNGTWADETQLSRFDRIETVSALKDAQQRATGERAVGIAFLLATLREDYQTNRKQLVEQLNECRQLSYPKKQECAYYISSYLMVLARERDTSLLPEIFSVHDLSDGAFSEELGCFYSDTLNDHPREFLSALSSYPKKSQQELCSMTGAEDGGGMNDDRYFEVRRLLNRISIHKKDPLAATARNCLQAVEEIRAETLKQRRLWISSPSWNHL